MMYKKTRLSFKELNSLDSVNQGSGNRLFPLIDFQFYFVSNFITISFAS